VRTIAPEIPSGVAAVLDRALAYERSQRFASARDMQAALRLAAATPSATSAAQAGAPTTGFAEGAEPRFRRTVAGCAAALLATVVALLVASRGGSAAPHISFLPRPPVAPSGSTVVHLEVSAIPERVYVPDSLPRATAAPRVAAKPPPSSSQAAPRTIATGPQPPGASDPMAHRF
jgi:hypothetical protein